MSRLWSKLRAFSGGDGSSSESSRPGTLSNPLLDESIEGTQMVDLERPPDSEPADLVPPVTFEVRNMAYSVKTAQIMQDINCTLYPGEVCALMGPSGAGKTTLLNVLACRASGRVEGEVLLNGAPANARLFKRVANYVPQDDDMLTSLTPRTQLEYVAELRLARTPADISKGRTRRAAKLERSLRVSNLLRQIRLDVCADVIIGGDGVLGGGVKGISGGQKKRVSIAMELVNEPSALFLDEPTSGLDSATAEECVAVVSALGRDRGLNVVCTIHQPNAAVFLSFDELLLLFAGRVVYHGSPEKALRYLESCMRPDFSTNNGGRKSENPADVLLGALAAASRDEALDFAHRWNRERAAMGGDLSMTEVPDDSSESPTTSSSQRRPSWHGARRSACAARSSSSRSSSSSAGGTTPTTADAVAEHYIEAVSTGFVVNNSNGSSEAASPKPLSSSSSSLRRSWSSWSLNQRRLNDMIMIDDNQPLMSSSSGGGGDYPITRFDQFCVLFRRACFDHKNAKLRIQLGVAIGVGLLYGLVFYRLGNKQSDYDMRLSALFMAVIYNGMMCVSQTSILVPLEKKVLLREYQNGYYALAPYFLAAVATRFCFQVLASTCWAIPFYLMSGLQRYSWRNVLVFFLAVYALAFIGLVYGFTLGTVAKSPQKAQQLLIPCIMPLIIFCGFLLQYDGVQNYFLPIWYFSFFRYAFTILVVNEFKHGTFEPCHLFKRHDYCPLGGAENEEKEGIVARSLVITKRLDFDTKAVPNYFYVLALYAGLLSCFAYYVLKYQASRPHG